MLCFSVVARSSARHESLAVTEVQHLAKFWPVTIGWRDPRLPASPRKQVEHDLPDSRPASSPSELGSGRTEVLEDGADAVWLTHDIHVVQVGEEVFVRQQEILKREQSAMLSEGVQHGHESIALLSPFALVDHMGVTAVVGPEILGGRSKLEHERKHSVAPTDLLEAVQHRYSGSHVKRTNPVNKEHGGTTVQVCERLDGVCHAFSTCLGCQRVLKRRSRLRHCRRDLLSDAPRDQPPNKIPTRPRFHIVRITATRPMGTGAQSILVAKRCAQSPSVKDSNLRCNCFFGTWPPRGGLCNKSRGARGRVSNLEMTGMSPHQNVPHQFQ